MPSFAMKVYDLQWFTTFGMSPEQAADQLIADGIDTVLTQNRIDPLPSSGVDQAIYLESASGRAAGYDDKAWVTALKRNEIRVVQTSAVLFEPAALERFPDARPVDADGNLDGGFGWYVGICPTHEGHLAEKIGTIERVAGELAPDGIFLQFMRYPGFWENWTWAPDYLFTNRDRFCFCDRCRTLFAAACGVSLPAGSIAEQAGYILSRLGEEWTAWRCNRIVQIVSHILERAHAIEPGLGVMLNTLPFPASDFGGIDVRRTIAAQDLPLLASTVEGFELMTYLQILNRPVSWIGSAITDARALLPADRRLVCTLQVDSLYTDGIFAGRGRAATIEPESIETAAHAALDAGADGLVFYHWTDFLLDEARGGRKRSALRAITGA